MSHKEIKDLINKLDNTNAEELKPKLIRQVNELILNINDESICDAELENLCNFLIAREGFRENMKEEASKEETSIEGLIIEEFIKSFEEFICQINNEKYIEDIIELINNSLRGIGGIARGVKVMKKYVQFEDYNSPEHLMELKEEFYKQLRSYSSKGIYEEQLIVFGLINTIKFQLEEQLQEHGRFIISMLTDYKTKNIKSINEFQEEAHLNEVKVKMKREFAIELQRRIYIWDSLTWKLQDHYYLERLYEE